jgi:hypothetical protein
MDNLAVSNGYVQSDGKSAIEIFSFRQDSHFCSNQLCLWFILAPNRWWSLHTLFFFNARITTTYFSLVWKVVPYQYHCKTNRCKWSEQCLFINLFLFVLDDERWLRRQGWVELTKSYSNLMLRPFILGY